MWTMLLALACVDPTAKTDPVAESGDSGGGGDCPVGDTSAQDTAAADTAVADTGAPSNAVADFALVDLNPNSARCGEVISPRDYLEQTSGWYFTHAT